MRPTSPQEKESGPRRIDIRNEHFGFANVEAWLNILRSYRDLHPKHRVTILYQGEPIQNRMALFKLERPVNLQGFELVVAADDQEFGDVRKLYRLLVEGAGPDCEKFIQKDIHQIQALF